MKVSGKPNCATASSKQQCCQCQQVEEKGLVSIAHAGEQFKSRPVLIAPLTTLYIQRS